MTPIYSFDVSHILFLNRRLVADNYASVTKKHFLQVCGSNGRDPFARDMVMRSSGFIKEIPVTIPTSHEVCGSDLMVMVIMIVIW